MAKLVKRFLFSGTPAGSWIAEAGTLALRVFAGVSLALTHGFPMLPPSEGFIGNVGNLGFPMPTAFAWAAKLSEFVGGVLLALGLLTRPAAFLIVCTMATAAFIHHAPDPFARKEMALLYFAIAVMFLLKGAGVWSMDRLIRG